MSLNQRKHEPIDPQQVERAAKRPLILWLFLKGVAWPISISLGFAGVFSLDSNEWGLSSRAPGPHSSGHSSAQASRAPLWQEQDVGAGPPSPSNPFLGERWTLHPPRTMGLPLMRSLTPNAAIANATKAMVIRNVVMTRLSSSHTPMPTVPLHYTTPPCPSDRTRAGDLALAMPSPFRAYCEMTKG